MSIKHPVSRVAAQRGGTLLGVSIGLALGLVIALAAAIYVNRASLPFMNRFQPRASGAAGASLPADWNPNQVVRGASAAASAAQPTPAASTPLSAKAINALGEPPSGVVRADAPHAPAATVSYYVQIGAYGNRNDADGQRAKVALSGLEAELDQHTVGDKTLWRVRVGPFGSSADANQAQKTLHDSGIEASVVKQVN